MNYEGVEKDLRYANLDEETEYWTNVDDFWWLCAVQSPNWLLLLEQGNIKGFLRFEISRYT